MVFWNYSVVMRLIFLWIITYTIQYVFYTLGKSSLNLIFYLITFNNSCKARKYNCFRMKQKTWMLLVLNTGIAMIYYSSISDLYASTDIVSEQSSIFRNIFSQSFLLTSSFRIHRETQEHKLSKSFNMLILDKTHVLSAFFRKIKYCIGNLIITNLQA